MMRSFGMTNIPSLVVSTASNFDSVSKPFVTSLHKCQHLLREPSQGGLI